MDNLRVFNTFERKTGFPGTETGPNLSEDQVREKIRQHQAKKGLDAKAEVSPKGRRLNAFKGQDGDLKGRPPLLRPGEERPVSAVGANNPASSMTQEKLKSLLKSGAFHFNENEKKVLAEILK